MKPVLLPVALALMAAGPAQAQDLPVRDCRPDAGVVLPVVPNGHDVIVAHATDDLLGASIFQRHGKTQDGTEVDISVARYDSYDAQLPDYLACETAFLRATHAQLTLWAAETAANPATRMVPVYFYGWSNGSDAVVARGADSVGALSGASIVTDAARLDLALQLARDAADMPVVRLDADPAAAFAAGSDIPFAVLPAHAAEVITAGDVGTGAEGSVAGARTVLTTTSASRVLGDVLVVRQDFLDANPDVVRATVRALLKAEELFREDAKKQVVDFALAAELVLGDAALEDRMQAMWSGVETVGLAGQVDWATDTNPRSFRSIVNSGQSAMVAAGLIDAAIALDGPPIDFASLGDDLWDKRRVNASGFDQDAATAAVRALSNEEVDGQTIASETILFKPNQATFPIDDYRAAFEEALQKSQVYAGAVLSIEAHSSYLGYLRGVLKEDWPIARQKRELVSLRNTSTARALAVRDALVETASSMGITIDESQFVINGKGIEDPLGGFCSDLPCPPKTEEEWNNSRRVVFRVIGMEAEESVFTPLNEW